MMKVKTLVRLVKRGMAKFLDLMREGLEQNGKDYYWWTGNGGQY